MIGILDLNIGNLHSVASAVYELGFDCEIVSHAQQFDDISHLILPGVGQFATAVDNLTNMHLIPILQDFACSGRPLMGICLGMQLLATVGHEGGDDTQGLGLIAGEVKRFPETDLRVPHIGWNTLYVQQWHPVFEGLKDERDFYFAHSYYFDCAHQVDILSVSSYGRSFPSAVGHKNIFGLQFHPEKSQKNGLMLLENFCNWDGQC